jgi:dehydration protein DpgD
VLGSAIAKVDEKLFSRFDCCAGETPLAVRAITQVSLNSVHLSLEQAFEAYYEAESARRNSLDCLEGPTAFVEGRKPVWTAR